MHKIFKVYVVPGILRRKEMAQSKDSEWLSADETNNHRTEE